jgi:hypothetical protein
MSTTVTAVEPAVGGGGCSGAAENFNLLAAGSMVDGDVSLNASHHASIGMKVSDRLKAYAPSCTIIANEEAILAGGSTHK